MGELAGTVEITIKRDIKKTWNDSQSSGNKTSLGVYAGDVRCAVIPLLLSCSSWLLVG
jgi:hypothetical protein